MKNVIFHVIGAPRVVQCWLFHSRGCSLEILPGIFSVVIFGTNLLEVNYVRLYFHWLSIPVTPEKRKVFLYDVNYCRSSYTSVTESDKSSVDSLNAMVIYRRNSKGCIHKTNDIYMAHCIFCLALLIIICPCFLGLFPYC